MSSQELRAFFPSPAHPALPIAAQLLSALRNLTGPGKGVNLRAEERTALVGVAALLGCEKIQSKDLSESSAQKASHVAPAQFRSALSLSRKLLSSSTASATDGLASSRKSSPSKRKGSESGETSPDAAARAAAAALSPFSTSRKKFRPAASGIDLSGLNSRGDHSPAKGSPLKQSATPSSARRSGKAPMPISQIEGPKAEDEAEEEEEEEEEEEPEEAEVQTPSKKAKTVAVVSSVGGSSGRRARRPDESTNAFFALRPGAMATPPDLPMVASSPSGRRRDRSASPTPRREAAGMMSAKRKSQGDKPRRRKLRKIDWTFHEDIWGGLKVQRRNDLSLKKIRKDLDAFLKTHNIPSKANGAAGITDILLEASISPPMQMDVDV